MTNHKISVSEALQKLESGESVRNDVKIRIQIISA